MAVFDGGKGIRSCHLQSRSASIYKCFANAFGQPLKKQHCCFFLTLSFESPFICVYIKNANRFGAVAFLMVELRGFVGNKVAVIAKRQPVGVRRAKARKHNKVVRNSLNTKKIQSAGFGILVELRGFEPLTF